MRYLRKEKKSQRRRERGVAKIRLPRTVTGTERQTGPEHVRNGRVRTAHWTTAVRRRGAIRVVGSGVRRGGGGTCTRALARTDGRRVAQTAVTRGHLYFPPAVVADAARTTGPAAAVARKTWAAGFDATRHTAAAAYQYYLLATINYRTRSRTRARGARPPNVVDASTGRKQCDVYASY